MRSRLPSGFIIRVDVAQTALPGAEDRADQEGRSDLLTEVVRAWRKCSFRKGSESKAPSAQTTIDTSSPWSLRVSSTWFSRTVSSSADGSAVSSGTLPCTIAIRVSSPVGLPTGKTTGRTRRAATPARRFPQ